MITMSEFLLQEMKRRGFVSARAFADWLGIAHTTINRMLNEKDSSDPNAKTMAILSKKLDVPIETLFVIAYPEIDDAQLSQDPEALALAQQIVNLPPQERQVIESAIIGMLARIKQVPE